jgi:8-oxo-dGTP pyrophosphatase MutT (NUDIX family)
MRRASALAEELRDYYPGDAAEEQHLSRILALLRTSAPFSRNSFAPGHITASCYIVDCEGRLLLHHHRRLNRWLQMGGHVEDEETTRGAALREGSEESGLRDLELIGGVFDLDIHPIPAAKGEPDHAHFDVRYLARTSRPDSIAIDDTESNELAWFTLDRALDAMQSVESQRVVRKIEALWRS